MDHFFPRVPKPLTVQLLGRYNSPKLDWMEWEIGIESQKLQGLMKLSFT